VHEDGGLTAETMLVIARHHPGCRSNPVAGNVAAARREIAASLTATLRSRLTTSRDDGGVRARREIAASPTPRDDNEGHLAMTTKDISR